MLLSREDAEGFKEEQSPAQPGLQSGFQSVCPPHMLGNHLETRAAGCARGFAVAGDAVNGAADAALAAGGRMNGGSG